MWALLACVHDKVRQLCYSHLEEVVDGCGNHEIAYCTFIGRILVGCYAWSVWSKRNVWKEAWVKQTVGVLVMVCGSCDRLILRKCLKVGAQQGQRSDKWKTTVGDHVSTDKTQDIFPSSPCENERVFWGGPKTNLTLKPALSQHWKLKHKET